MKNLRVFLMRHAEPVTYGYSTSGLNREGFSQIVETANKFLDIYQDGDKHKVQILYSSRKRTRESAIKLNKEIQKVRDKNIQILIPHSLQILQTADTINGVLEMGYPLKDALKEWSTMPSSRLIKYHIQTPQEIIDSIIKYFSSKNFIATDIIAVTHETTLMAFQKKYFPKIKSRPKYTEIMEILFDKKQNLLIIKYQGKEISTHASWRN